MASTGLTEAQAREQGYEVRVSNLPMAHAPRDTRGLIKLAVNAEGSKLATLALEKNVAKLSCCAG